MGGSSWSGSTYNTRSATRKITGQSAFTYQDEVIANTPYSQRHVHEEMDPLKFKNGMRESRDSESHPESNAIAVFFDVTGSMYNTPRTLQEKLGGLMALLTEKQYITDPQIMFGAIGDAYSDRAPLQVGQFESGLEMEDDIGKLYLEGGGGGQKRETYELGFYILARHTAIDCFEKRGKKGYAFFIGDEMPYQQVNKKHVQSVIGDVIGENIPTEVIFKELSEKYNVYHIIPEEYGASCYVGDKEVANEWKKYVVENQIHLDSTAAIAETIALTIGLCEGTIDLEEGLEHIKELGLNVKSASKAVSTVIQPGKNIVATGDMPLPSRAVNVTRI
jgi:hypothetical protein